MKAISILKLSLERIYRLRKINNKFKKSRNKLSSEIWWKISDDWHTAFDDNMETDREMEARFL